MKTASNAKSKLIYKLLDRRWPQKKLTIYLELFFLGIHIPSLGPHNTSKGILHCTLIWQADNFCKRPWPGDALEDLDYVVDAQHKGRAKGVEKEELDAEGGKFDIVEADDIVM